MIYVKKKKNKTNIHTYKEYNHNQQGNSKTFDLRKYFLKLQRIILFLPYILLSKFIKETVK